MTRKSFDFQWLGKCFILSYTIKKLLLSAIYFYRRVISPLFGQRCRFYPSCSEYAVLSIAKYGIFKGGARSVKRIFSCHPFNPAGIDYP